MTCPAQYDRTPLEGGPRSAGPVEAALSRRPLRGSSPGMEILVAVTLLPILRARVAPDRHPPDRAVMPHRRSR
jgi:hypothetical protein